MVNKIALTILVSIILTTILISLVNVGINILLDEPEYEDYCAKADLRYDYPNKSEAQIEQMNEDYRICNEEYESAQRPYNQNRYYILASIGLTLLLIGLFAKENMIQITGLGTGGILMTEGIVINLENEMIVFFSLLAILAVFGVVAYRIINKKN